MNKLELKSIIREVVEEVMKDDFVPLGVAQEWRLDEAGPPGFPKKLRKQLITKYKKKYPNDEKRAMKAAFGTMWKIFYAKKKGNKKINEMWMAFEGEDHDETDMNNPEEEHEVALAKKIKKIADELLAMHGADTETSEDKK
jgi:hypothetical protein